MFVKRRSECQQVFPLCQTCDSRTNTCTKCQRGFYPSGGTSCEQCPEGCKECESASACVECQSGFTNNGGVCQRLLRRSPHTKHVPSTVAWSATQRRLGVSRAWTGGSMTRQRRCVLAVRTTVRSVHRRVAACARNTTSRKMECANVRRVVELTPSVLVVWQLSQLRNDIDDVPPVRGRVLHDRHWGVSPFA